MNRDIERQREHGRSGGRASSCRSAGGTPAPDQSSDDEFSVSAVGVAAIAALVGFGAGRLSRRIPALQRAQPSETV